ncbi:MAG TPA: class II aldolase/adducin family protein [Terriglobales bacterium]|nr:class II aldolase/adducin family protein [Terriglobales bacterium]
MPTDHQFRREIIRCGSLLHSCGFIAATDGNVSIRLDDERVLVTPTGMSKGMMRTSDLVVVDMEGRKIKGRREVTSEIGMHLLIYRMRPDIHAVVHAHPHTATGFAAAGIPLNQPLVCEVVIGLGQIPLAPYGTPGTPELAETLEPLIPDYDAILMANHGVVTYGSDLQSAYMKMETVEHFAQITLVTHLLGKQQPLECAALEKLVAARSRYLGVNSAARMPVFAGSPSQEEVEEPADDSTPFHSHAIHHRRGSAHRHGN